MKTKQCGNCEFWDRANAKNINRTERLSAECKFPLPFFIEKLSPWEDKGQDCHVYKEKS